MGLGLSQYLKINNFTFNSDLFLLRPPFFCDQVNTYDQDDMCDQVDMCDQLICDQVDPCDQVDAWCDQLICDQVDAWCDQLIFDQVKSCD